MSERAQELVAVALHAAGIEPSPDDVVSLAGTYPEVRAMVELLYGVDGAEDQLPEPIVEP